MLEFYHSSRTGPPWVTELQPYIAMVWPPLLAVSISLLLIYAIFALAGLAPLPFACSLHDAGVINVDLEII
jgi:hypothetical protein